MNNEIKINARTDYIGELIKLVAGENTDKICSIAKNIKKVYDSEDIPLLDNRIIYSAYCSDNIKEIRGGNI